ncbi:hypothetical protein LY254_08200 [Synechococcus sp. NB0720_010]|nr:hypothetical protein [Synechococcus sp. NB0720_010]UPH89277.1 hypothetical protein LY254_08200 [Synechococcus sp. NB0720_010]
MVSDSLLRPSVATKTAAALLLAFGQPEENNQGQGDKDGCPHKNGAGHWFQLW